MCRRFGRERAQPEVATCEGRSDHAVSERQFRAKSAMMVIGGERQGQSVRVVRLPHRRQAGDRR